MNHFPLGASIKHLARTRKKNQTFSNLIQYSSIFHTHANAKKQMITEKT